jgi:hypothetical protein
VGEPRRARHGRTGRTNKVAFAAAPFATPQGGQPRFGGLCLGGGAALAGPGASAAPEAPGGTRTIAAIHLPASPGRPGLGKLELAETTLTAQRKQRVQGRAAGCGRGLEHLHHGPAGDKF